MNAMMTMHEQRAQAKVRAFGMKTWALAAQRKFAPFAVAAEGAS